MNRIIQKYVNFLLDNNPSPFCEYIIYKELLKLDDKTVSESYEWAKRFKLYTEIRDEQFPDGSWSDFYPMDTSPEVRKKHKHTNRATIRRLHDLSLGINDEMVAKTVDFCKRFIAGEPQLNKTHNLPDDIYHKKSVLNYICSVIYGFNPDDELIADYKKENTLSDDKQRAYLIYEWDHGPFNIVKLSDSVSPESDAFVFLMCGLEDLKDYSLFGEFMAEKTAPYLYSLCERLVDPNDDISIRTNRYYNKVGQYSESWNNNEIKKKDLLLRIIRILYKCE